MLKNILCAMAATTLCLAAPTQTEAAELGKVGLAPTYIRVDVLRENKTAKTLDLPAMKADATFVLYKGFCFKTSGLVASNDGDLANASAGFGQIIPVAEGLYITPHAGVGYTYMKTSMTYYEAPFEEAFTAIAPYIGVDTSYQITDALRFGANLQYAWSRSNTILTSSIPGMEMSTYKGNSEGFTIGSMVEYDVTDSFSLNVGAAYNASMDKSQNGLRGFGIKYGFSYWL